METSKAFMVPAPSLHSRLRVQETPFGLSVSRMGSVGGAQMVGRSDLWRGFLMVVLFCLGYEELVSRSTFPGAFWNLYSEYRLP